MIDLSFSDTDSRLGTRKVFVKKRLLRGATAVIHEESMMGDRSIPRFTSVTFNGKSVKAISSSTILDLFKHVENFNIEISFSKANIQQGGWEFSYLRIGKKLFRNPSECPIYIPVSFDIDRWDKPYSISDLAFHVHQALNNIEGRYSFQAQSKDTLTDGFGLYISLPVESKIEDVLALVVPDLERIVTYTQERLGLQGPQTISARFDFPLEVRPACEQYLLYFGQFLRDLGIEANTQLTEQASNVLFTVAPLNKEQALDAIRDALSCYLQMPGSPEAMSALDLSQDVAAMQLQSNIFHLKSQLQLAAAVVQAKDATIRAQETEIVSLRESFDLRRYLPASPEPDNVDRESLIDGVVAVKKYDYKGFEFDLPAIARRLKRLVSGER